MTIKEVKEMYAGQYIDVEVYMPVSRGEYYPNEFHTDNCNYVLEYDDNAEAGLYELMDEVDYTQTILANMIDVADFNEWYGDSNAKVLCVMLK